MIMRPAPLWQPGPEWELVFVNVCSNVYVSQARNVNGEFEVKYANGNTTTLALFQIKPYTPESYGKKWEEMR